jgi:hypothetical protein
MGSKPLAKRLREKRNHPPPDEPWIWHTREMYESAAWRSLSRTGRMVIERIELEHMAHAGTENGNLIVTFADFVKYGVHREVLKAAIADAAVRGVIVITQQGKPSVGATRFPTKFALGWLPLSDGSPPINRWKWWTPSPAPLPTQDIYSGTETVPGKNGRNGRIPSTENRTGPGAESRTGKTRKTANPRYGIPYQGK